MKCAGFCDDSQIQSISHVEQLVLHGSLAANNLTLMIIYKLCCKAIEGHCVDKFSPLAMHIRELILYFDETAFLLKVFFYSQTSSLP